MFVSFTDSFYFCRLVQLMSMELRLIADAIANRPLFSEHARNVNMMATMRSSVIKMAMNEYSEALLELVVLFIVFACLFVW